MCHAALQLLALPALVLCPTVTRAPAAREQPLPRAPLLPACSPCPARPCCLRAAPTPCATAACEQPLPRAPLVPVSSPYPTRPFCPRAVPAPAHPVSRVRALLLCASHPAAARASRSAAPRVAPCCSPHVTPWCPARRTLLQPARRALLQPACRALLPPASCTAAARASRPAALHSAHPAARAAQAKLPSCYYCCCYCCSCPATTTATAAAAPATAATGGGVAGSARGAPGAAGTGGAAGSTGGAAGAGGAGPTTDRHCLSWPLSQQLQRLGVDSSGHCLSRTTPPLSSFVSGLFSKAVLLRCVPGRVEAAALGSSESAAAPGAGESAATLSARESADALGASASTAIGPASTEALHTFTLDSGMSCCFFHDCTIVTPLAAPVPVSLADPTGGLVVARASTFLPCPAVPSRSLSGLHLPAFSTNLLSNAVLQDEWVDTFIPGGQRVAICKCSRTGHHLATFTRQPGCGLYTLTTVTAQVAESGQVAASSQVSASGQLAASCSCQVLSHQTLLWHHRLGHPSVPRLRSMHSRLLVSGLPRSLPSLPRSPAPPCLPCVEGQQRAAPHSSEFPPTTAPLQILHMDIWGPTPIGGTDQERYFLLVVDDYTRYTTVFPLRHKADISSVLIPWIRATRRQLHERFRRDFPVLRLHSVRGASPQKNGIAERRIGLIMEVARTSMFHAAAPHFRWLFAVRYAAHQLNLWPRVTEPETSPTLRWTGKVGDASVFRVWGALSLVRDAKVSKLSSRTLYCVFLGFPTDARPWQFYHPCSHRVFSSQDVTFDESVCFYRLHPHASHQEPAPSGVSQVDPTPLVEPLEISSDSSGPAEGDDPTADDTAATRRSPRLETPPGFLPRPSSLPPQLAAVNSGAETAGAEPGGAEIEGEGSGGAATGGAATRATAA
ncbi:unnamed protein product [Closterium sp. NIES-54]